MIPKLWLKALSMIILTTLVMFSSGCGGGGGGGGTVAPTGEAPDAQFTVTPTIGSFPLTVSFDATLSSDSDGDITQYQWDFGDGADGDGVTTQHTYRSAGPFTAILTVTDNDGMTGSNSFVIDVKRRFGAGGVIESANHTTSDSDVNDPNADYASNDSFTVAQIIPAPITVGGYVNVANAGAGGRSKVSGDANDFYQAFLAENMTVTLYMTADTTDADLNLYLYDDTQTLVDASLATGDAIDALTVPETGTYFVRIEAVENATTATATNYTLTIGQALSAASQFPLRLSDAFVPGEVIVTFKNQGISTQSAAISIPVQEMGLVLKAYAPGSGTLFELSENRENSGAMNTLGGSASIHKRFDFGNISTEMREKLETLWMVKTLRNRRDVAFSDPNFIRKPLRIPNDSFYDVQWHYPLINLPQAWDVTTGSSSVIVAVIDTGVLLNHPDLSGQLVSGYDFISDTDIAADGDGLDPDPDDPGDQDIGGSSFHGTHVSGTIAAASNNARGGAGVAWNARIMPLRALGKGGGTVFDIMNAVRYAAGFSNPSGTTPSKAADIINLSIGGDSPTQSEANLYQQVRAAGVIIVAAAGNHSSSSPTYPASYPDVLSVSAVTIHQELADYSNFGTSIDVAAPGGDLQFDVNGDGHGDGVLSTSGDDTSGSIKMAYAISQGTSMAAPHVSGVIALMKSVYPSLTPNQFEILLKSGDLTQDIGLPGRDNSFGYGLIDANKAVQEAQALAGGGAVLPVILVANPGSLNFSVSIESANLSLLNGGGAGSLQVTQVSEEANWLTVTPTSNVSNSGLGTYLVQVDRFGLAPGTYTTTITFESTANNVNVPVVMQVFVAPEISDAGFHYILLLDPVTQETLKQLDIGSDDDGNYPYLFTDLAYGEEYLIFAGSDPNNNHEICESGEACGAYISLDKPQALTILGDRTDLDFTTEFAVSLPAISSSSFVEKQAPLKRIVLKEIAH
jgi:serine protease